MKLVKRNYFYTPFTELAQLHEDMDELFGTAFGRESNRGLFRNSWEPAVDIYDAEDKFVIKADIPGMEKKDIEVTIHENTVTIKGEKKSNSETRDGDRLRTERVYGSFMRSVTLPAEVDASQVKAEYNNGTLELSLAKRGDAQPKQIKVDIT